MIIVQDDRSLSPKIKDEKVGDRPSGTYSYTMDNAMSIIFTLLMHVNKSQTRDIAPGKKMHGTRLLGIM